MSYQLCRWYDTHPRLAFALKLLYFAPQDMRRLASQDLTSFLGKHLGLTLSPQQNASNPSGNRWYDDTDETAHLVELLKQSPDPLKTLSANRIIHSLTQTPVH